MKFPELYDFANGLGKPNVTPRELADVLAARHRFVSEVRFYEPKLDPEVSFGHLKWEMDRSSAYEDDYLIASIRVHNELPEYWGKFVAAKELMHVFDSPDAKTDDAPKFLRLLTELETTPVAMSPMLLSEYEAEWMARAVVFPRKLRDSYVTKQAGGMDVADIAKETHLPEGIVGSMLGPFYDRNLKALGLEV